MSLVKRELNIRINGACIINNPCSLDGTVSLTNLFFFYSLFSMLANCSNWAKVFIYFHPTWFDFVLHFFRMWFDCKGEDNCIKSLFVSYESVRMHQIDVNVLNMQFQLEKNNKKNEMHVDISLVNKRYCRNTHLVCTQSVHCAHYRVVFGPFSLGACVTRYSI